MTGGDPVISVLVIEDNALTRLGLKSLLEAFDDVRLVGVAATGLEGIALHRQLRPDVVVTDLKMAGIDGVTTIRELRRADPDARILVLSHYEAEEDVYRALDAGALGYITKADPPAEIIATLRSVHRGVRTMPPRIFDKWRRRDAAPGLTPRERRVLERVKHGLSNREIGAELGIAVKTVEKDVRAILSKLDVGDRAAAVAEAIRRGILGADL